MIKVQRFWSKTLRDKVDAANKALKTKNITLLEEILDDFINSLKNPQADWKDRVAICFILEQMAGIEPLMKKIVQSLKIVLEKETDVHVREFSVWSLGKIVEKSLSLELIRETMPIIIKFLSDDSEQVKAHALTFHTRFSAFIQEKEGINDQIQKCRNQLMDLIKIKLDEMKVRSDLISKEALALDYRNAFEKYDEMKKKISQFNEDNQKQENEILAEEAALVEKMPAFKGESNDIIRYWREKRGEKEDLIRRVDCIIRIQSKMFNIIRFIISRPNQDINMNELQEITRTPGRQYTEKEIVEILQQLVDEEIIPNFMLDQIKDYQIQKELLNEEKDQINDKKPSEGTNSEEHDKKNGSLKQTNSKSSVNSAKENTKGKSKEKSNSNARK